MEKAFIVIAICFLIYQIFFKRSFLTQLFIFFSLLSLIFYTLIVYKHFPVTGLFETLTFYAFSIITINLFIKNENELYHLISNIFSILILAFSLLLNTKKSAFTPDALNTILFPLHVAFSFIGYAFFTLAFFLVISKSETKKILNMNYLGFSAFTIGLWTGGIWAYKAWGAYFLYSIKEIFSFVIWVYYAGTIHLRFIKEREKLLKISTAIGFLIVIFTYLGIGIFMKNTHSLG